jgi:hypothetical protein
MTMTMVMMMMMTMVVVIIMTMMMMMTMTTITIMPMVTMTYHYVDGDDDDNDNDNDNDDNSDDDEDDDDDDEIDYDNVHGDKESEDKITFPYLFHISNLLLEQQDDAVHDAHNEMRRLGQLTHSGDVGRLDGLQSRFCLLQSRSGCLQFLLSLRFVNLWVRWSMLSRSHKRIHTKSTKRNPTL